MGCETLQFYRQAVWGQWQLLQARVPLEQAKEDAALDHEVRKGLELAAQILDFAAAEMAMQPNGRYQSYVHLDRAYVVWNVFAAGPYELEGTRWCYPVVGCAPYRGYFKEASARRTAEKYTARGLETYVGGVPAYSTLGWFDDPLLSTFVVWPEPDLANLLIHELAHSQVWVAGDVAFNESFAEFVGNRGAKAWLASQGKSGTWLDWQTQRRAWRTFRDFVVAAKAYLSTVYARPERDLLKTDALIDLRMCYQAHRDRMGDGRYDELMAEHFNNAFLVSVGTYADWLPAFAELFEQSSASWPAFFTAVETLGELSAEDRNARLQALTEQQKSHRTDHGDTHQVNCEAFLRHGPHAESAGGESDDIGRSGDG